MKENNNKNKQSFQTTVWFRFEFRKLRKSVFLFVKKQNTLFPIDTKDIML